MHIKVLTEIFDVLAVLGDSVSEEDHVVHLRASLLNSIDMLITSLEAIHRKNSDISGTN